MTVTVGVVVGSGAGVAWARFASTGSGSGSGTVVLGGTIAVDARVNFPTGSLLPGASADASFTVDNPNAQAVTVSQVTGGTITVTGTGCTAANSGVSFTNQTGLSISVPAGSVAFPIDLAGAVLMSTSSNTACQNASFSIAITVSAQQ